MGLATSKGVVDGRRSSHHSALDDSRSSSTSASSCASEAHGSDWGHGHHAWEGPGLPLGPCCASDWGSRCQLGPATPHAMVTRKTLMPLPRHSSGPAVGARAKDGRVGVTTPTDVTAPGTAAASTADDAWGYWAGSEEDDDGASSDRSAFALGERSFSPPLVRRASEPPVVHLPSAPPPPYILDEALPSQALWHVTAGRRPQQPPEERARFEALWASNFAASQVRYGSSPSSGGGTSGGGGGGRKGRVVVRRGTSPWLATSVSKSFVCPGCGGSVRLELAVSSFRVVRGGGGRGSGGGGGDEHAEFLIMVRVGDAPAFGAWKRFTDFAALARTLSRTHARRAAFRRSLVAWEALLKRRRWARCLDADYLSLKCLLLQRFLHALVFDSAAPSPLREFIGFVP